MKKKSSPTANGSIPIVIQDHAKGGILQKVIAAPRRHWPVRVGVPFPRGGLWTPDTLDLRNERDESIPFEAHATSSWQNGSIRWVALDFFCDLDVDQTKEHTLRYGKTCKPAMIDGGVMAEETSAAIVVNAGRISFEVPKTGCPLLNELVVDDQLLISSSTEQTLVDGKGTSFKAANCRASLSDHSKLHAVVRIEGEYRSDDGRRCLNFDATITARWNVPHLLIAHRFLNLEEPEDGVSVRRLTLRQTYDVGNEPKVLVRQMHRGMEWLPRLFEKRGPVEIVTDGFRSHVKDMAWLEENVAEYPPYLRKGQDNVEPWFAISGSRGGVLCELEDNQMNAPKSVRIDGATLEWDLIPESSEPMHIPQGMAKTHRLTWFFHTGALKAEDRYTEAIRIEQPPMVSVPPAWTHSSHVNQIDRVLPYQPRKYPRTEMWLRSMMSLNWPRGMFHYGDDTDAGYTQSYAAIGIKEGGQVWTNNEYDFIHAAMTEYLRTGQWRHWIAARNAARHLMDVDFVHYSSDPWKHHGVPAHSVGHTTAASYPSHLWVEGLLEYHWVTGDPEALRIARCIGDTLLKYIHERFWVIEATAREGGWTMIALAALYEATWDQKYFEGLKRVADCYLKFGEQRGKFFPYDGTFFIGIAIIGMFRWADVSGELKRVVKASTTILDWWFENRLSPEGVPLYHYDSAFGIIGSGENMFPQALALVYEQTKKKPVLDMMRKMFASMRGYNGPWSTKSTTVFYLSSQFPMRILDEKKLLKRFELSAGSVRSE